ncbi:MAG: hypothetical protein SPJ82_01610 [Prevotella sp.]|uniref:hypothetical protein n=1 Tax=Prevotella sp. P3-122 TaxID=2024223 RepID=UPI000BC9B9B6|nr:hypothetical protein [Prevotella sp. P3-122]MDD6867054.1 hypothetical protein [Prevotella sp.]MDY3669769.1 hypothetical protein [Prevotella sp.]MDY5849562.1 hypothetical protein [Prevotella sp.]OYP58871.1 hypothetical protein CIL02_12965 [Prevotella sp. P3-122]
MKLTNHYLLMAATVAAAMLLNPQRCLADDDLVEAYQFTATTMTGSSVSVILAKSDDKEGPRMLHKDRVFRLDGKEINASDIQYIRIAKTMVSAIREIDVQPVPHVDNNVYSINGQLVRRNADTLDNLPKGIYIVNGKKHIVK